jgi:hypothetical protein
MESQVALPKILISAAFSSIPGGVERVIGNIHKQLLQQGFEVDTLIARSEAAASLQRFMDVPAVERPRFSQRRTGFGTLPVSASCTSDTLPMRLLFPLPAKGSPSAS